MIRISTQQAGKLFAYLSDKDIPKDSILGEMLDNVRDQLSHPRHAGDLVETIAGLVATPRAKVSLNGNLLHAIRGALLSPRELARAKALEATAQGCANCGQQLLQGEMVNLTGQQPYCVRCAAPTILSCNKCKLAIALPASVMRIVTKVLKECKGCAEGAKPMVDEDEVRPQDVQGPRPGRETPQTFRATIRNVPTPNAAEQPFGQWMTTNTFTAEVAPTTADRLNRLERAPEQPNVLTAAQRERLLRDIEQDQLRRAEQQRRDADEMVRRMDQQLEDQLFRQATDEGAANDALPEAEPNEA